MGNNKIDKITGRRSGLRRCLSVLLAVLLTCSVLPAKAGERIYAAQSGQVSVSGTEYYDYAYEVLTLVNDQRAKVGRSALSLDAHLTEVAMQRAAECSVSFSHTRPNGQSCFTVDSVWSSASAYGENIAYSYNSSASVMNGWVNSQGHYANIVNGSYRSVGIGAVKIGNTFYWAQAFSSNASASAPQRGTKNATFTVETQAASSGSTKVPGTNAGSGTKTPGTNEGSSTKTPTANTGSGTQTVPGMAISLPTIIPGGCTGTGNTSYIDPSSVQALLKDLTQSPNCSAAPVTNCSTDAKKTCSTIESILSNGTCQTIGSMIPGSSCAADASCLVGTADCSGAVCVIGNVCTDAACVADSCLPADAARTQSSKGGDAKAQTAKAKNTKPGKVKSVKVSAKKGALKVSCSKASKADGYQVQVASKKSFCKSSVKKTLSTKKNSCTLSSLGSNEKCYVRVRSYCKSNGKTCYSAWSDVTCKKTK